MWLGFFLAFVLPAISAVPQMEVVSYNLYWWNVGQNNRWQALYNTINGQTFDLIGFQECEDVRRVVQSTKMAGNFDVYNPTDGGAFDNPAPVAWDSRKYEKIGEGFRKVGEDQYGDRVTVWVRLRVRAGGETVFFANTHGPLGDCSERLGNEWVNAVKNNFQQGDALVYTGDFNCGRGSAAINVIERNYGQPVAIASIDMIFTNGFAASSTRNDNGYPSDHPLVAAKFEGSSGSPTSIPTASSSSPTSSSSSPTLRTTSPTGNPTPDSGCEGPFDGYPECAARIEWLVANYLTSEFRSEYVANGVDGSRCSAQRFLSTVESFCPAVGEIPALSEDDSLSTRGNGAAGGAGCRAGALRLLAAAAQMLCILYI